VPAGELQAGDELRLANGGQAIVTANTRETAPLGETFTTYNFEVADFHTYFAGVVRSGCIMMGKLYANACLQSMTSFSREVEVMFRHFFRQSEK
jgi:hypothetical protein